MTAPGRNRASGRLKAACVAFALCFAGMAVILLYGMRGNGRFYLQADWQYQQVLFIKAIADAARSGEWLWSASAGLGADFVYSYGFYNLFSPFTWLAVPFAGSARLLYAAVTALTAVRFGAAGVTSFLYIRTKCRTDRAAVLGALLYAFNGWMLFNLNYHFIDAVLLFPLLLWALDRAMETGRAAPFAWMIGVCTLVNYMLFVGAAVYLCIYFAAGLFTREWKLTLRLFLRLAAAVLAGLALAAVVLVPSAFLLMQNTRASQMIFEQPVSEWFNVKPYVWMSALRSLLVPTDTMFTRTFMVQADLNAPELWLPMVGVIPAAAWCVKNKKSRIMAALLVSVVFLLIPVLNSAFSLFNASAYTRWLYCPALLLALASAKCFDESVPLRAGYAVWGALWALFAAGWALWTLYYQSVFVWNLLLAGVMIALSLAGGAATAAVPRLWRSRAGTALVLCAALLFGTASGILYVRYLQRDWDADDADIRLMTDAAQAYEEDFDRKAGRVDATYAWTNFGLYTGASSTSFFSSTMMPGTLTFYEAFGDWFRVSSAVQAEHVGLKSLLSVRYELFADAVRNETYDPDVIFTPDAGGSLTPVWTYDGGENGILRVYENPWYIPPAFTFDASITEEELLTIDEGLRHYAALKALVLTPEQQERYEDALPAVSAADMELTAGAFETDVAARRESAASEFSYEHGTYRAAVTLEHDNLVFFSVPYSPWWCAEVNGEEVVVERVDCGLTAVACPAGECVIELSYRPVPTYAGAGISAAALCALAVRAAAEIRGTKRLKKQKTS